MLTGPVTGTYYNIAGDLSVLGETHQLDIKRHPTSGSIQNVKMVYDDNTPLEGIVLGFAQSDVLGFLRRSQKPAMQEMAKNIALLLPLYSEEVHVLAGRHIRSFDALEGKKVVIGEDGSGHLITAINMFALTGITPAEMIRKAPPEGILAVLEGKADAAIFVAGKPVKLFENLESITKAENNRFAKLLKNIHLLPLSHPLLKQEYASSVFTKEDYTFVDRTIPTLTVTAMLITRNMQTPSSKTCTLLTQFKTLLKAQLPTLKQKGHTKWQEVNLDNILSGWEGSGCEKEAQKN